MRIRFKPWARPELEASEFYRDNPEELKGKWIQEFKNKFVGNPLYIYRKELQKLVEEELIEIELDKIKLTKKGLDFANIVWEEFI